MNVDETIEILENKQVYDVRLEVNHPKYLDVILQKSISKMAAMFGNKSIPDFERNQICITFNSDVITEVNSVFELSSRNRNVNQQTDGHTNTSIQWAVACSPPPKKIEARLFHA